MTIHIPWAAMAQLTEHTTGLNMVGPLRDCVRVYSDLVDDVRINVLLMTDDDIALPGRQSRRIFERLELESLLGLLDPEPVSTALVRALIARREGILQTAA